MFTEKACTIWNDAIPSEESAIAYERQAYLQRKPVFIRSFGTELANWLGFQEC